MTGDEMTEGLKQAPRDVTLGPHSECETCHRYFPTDILRLRFQRMRCPKCYAQSGGGESPGLF